MLPRNLFILTFALLARGSFAALPVAKLTATFPPGCPIGGTAEVTLTGTDLQGVSRLAFTDPRVTAKLLTPPATRPTDAVRFAVSVPPDVAPRACDLWAVGAYGVSNPRAFDVHAGAQQVLPPGHTSATTAFELPLDTTLFALAEPKAAHYLRLGLRKGATLTIDSEAARLDSKVEPQLVLFDPAGREVAWAAGERPLTYTPAADGPHVLRVQELLFRASPEYAYEIRAHAGGPAPRPAAPTAAGAFVDEAVSSAAVPLTIGETLKPPCVVRGTFAAPRYAATYRFDAPAGAVYWVELTCDRLGASAAPMLVVQRVMEDAAGHGKATDLAEVKPAPANAGLAGFSTATRDPIYRLECKEAASFRLLLRDLFGAGGGATDYVLSVRAPAPDFRLVALQAEPPKKESRDVALCGLLARRGGTVALDVVAVRRDGFDGPITLRVTGLPPSLSAPPTLIPAGLTSARIVIAANDDAATWAGPVGVEGEATVNGSTVRHAARPGAVSFTRYDALTNDAVVRSRVADAIMLAVSGEQAAPLALVPTTRPVIDAVAGTRTSVRMKLTYRETFTGPIVVTLAGHPAVVAAPATPVAGRPAVVDVPIDLAALKLPPGEFTLYARAEGNVNHADPFEPTPKALAATFYSEPFTLRVSPPPPPPTVPAKR